MVNPPKICSKCKISKDLEQFNFRCKTKDVRHGYCRECGKLFTQSNYKRNKRQYLDKNLRSVQKRREFVREMKNRPCADCGILYPYYVMDFDHREDETKKYLLSEPARMTINTMKAEIAKCDLVCANCHRERTHQRRIEKLNNAGFIKI